MDNSTSSPLFVHQLGNRHFAHLRAVAEGIPVAQAAQHYLGIHHGHQAVTVHRQAVEAVRALALRNREKTWRLVGLAIPVTSDSKNPTLEEFSQTTSWASEFSEAEVLEAYLERYPAGKKPTRRLKLRESLMSALTRLEKLAVQPPRPQDPIAGWFDSDTARRLADFKIVTLGGLGDLISQDINWHTALKSVGTVKAQRIEQRLASLLPIPPRKNAELISDKFSIATGLTLSNLQSLTPSPIAALNDSSASHAQHESLGSTTSEKSPSSWTLVTANSPEGYISSIPTSDQQRQPDCQLAAKNDAEAILEWASVRATSDITKKSYLREAARFLVWLHDHRKLRCLNDLKAADCKAYIDFLGNIPPSYLSDPKKRPKFGAAAWAPFRGQLNPNSRKQAIVIVASMYAWLAAAGYLSRNPWVIIKIRIPGTSSVKEATSKAFSEEWMEVILQTIEKSPPSQETARARFIFLFVESVGLRSSELLNATFKGLYQEGAGWFLRVTGKGDKQRSVFLPQQAVQALQLYLESRGIPSMENVAPEMPLLASARFPDRRIGYPALYATVKRWLEAARTTADLSRRDSDHLKSASTHWLRHTFGTRAVQRDVPYDVIQSQMGHSSIQTTMDTYAKAPKERLAKNIASAFDGSDHK